MDVICAGILVADHVCTPMDRLPGEGRLEAVEAMYLLTGGCAANVGVNVARQGVGVAVVGRVGDDIWGRFVREDLERLGVDTRWIATSPTRQTSQTMILLCKGQDRRFVHSFGANGELCAEDIPAELLERAKVMYVGGYLVLPGLLPESLAGLFARCRERGIRTVLDVVIPSSYVPAGELDPVLPLTDYFLPNNDEGELITGRTDPLEQIREFRARGVGTVVLTMGGEGLLFTDGDAVWQAAHFPTEVIDQTGAGDAFCAGFLSAMVRDLPLASGIENGSALGASCVRSIGCYQGVFTAPEAASFLEANHLDIRRVA